MLTFIKEVEKLEPAFATVNTGERVDINNYPSDGFFTNKGNI